ncbi:MAG: M6 family metalloprotease domain-containing protein [Planctomycetes bacterium]|nr:M6 family metalloprotease domain-containing protein [Planctomycetota bacterium]
MINGLREGGTRIKNKLYKYVVLAALFLSAVTVQVPQAFAVPANPAPAEFTQPDDTLITLHLRGDEHFHWLEDTHGFTVVRGSNHKYVYALLDGDDNLSATNMVVGKADPKAYGLQKRILPPRSKLKQMRRYTNSPRGKDNTSQNVPPIEEPLPVPVVGTIQNLVLLVSFSDVAVDYPSSDFNDLFNQIGYTYDGAVGSVKDFYHEASYNQLTPQSIVVEPVTLNNGFAYYGQNDAFGNDKRPREMVQEALAKLEARGFDFTTVDGDSDGWIDSLTVIHAGGAEEYSGNNSNYIWSHKWSMTSVQTYDGVSMYNYFTVPARRGWDSTPSTQGITRIGVICHEMGHFIGLPDLYDYGYDSEGAGDFCLMAGGSWNGSYGTSPAHPSAWCKADMGWLTPTVISADNYYTLPAVENDPNVYKLQGPFPANEYFLIENRQGIGFDSQLPGPLRGLLIWHIDENQPNNDDQTHYLVDLEEASGTQHLELNSNQGDDADYFRTGNATQFTDSTTPNNYSYSATPLGINVTDVGTTGSVMQFTLGSPGVFDHFEWDAIATQEVNVPFDVNIYAIDTSGYIADGFTGTVDLSASIGADGNEIEIGTGATASSYPISTYYEKRRTQTIYLSSEIGESGTITDIALYVTEVPAMVRNDWTIRMKHTTDSSTGRDWEDTGWTVVYQSNESPGPIGWQNYHFTTPFEYNDANNLMIDFSFDNNSYINAGASYITGTSAFRSLVFAVDSTSYGPPTTWSGTSPRGTRTKWIPNIQLKIGEPPQQILITPTTTPNFIDGVWEGQITFLESAIDVHLAADDAGGSFGDSNNFDVINCTLPTVDSPSPSNGQPDTALGSQLSWNLASGSPCATTYDVYFDTTNPPTTLLCDDTTVASCDPVLSCNTTYYWQVVAANCCGTTAGPVWSFTTMPPLPGDFDLNCVTDFDDLTQITNNWLTDYPLADIAPPGGDGIINIDDFAAFARSWLIQLAE